MKKRYVKPVISLCLIAALGIAGSLAYLTDTTDEVTNTFTAGDNIDITLEESTDDEYTIIPGDAEAKDPTVTLESGSADSYIFIDVIEYINAEDSAGVAYTFADYITYSVDDTKWELVGTVTDAGANTVTDTYVYVGSDTATDPVSVSAAAADVDMTILTDVTTTVIDDTLIGAVSYPETVTTAMLNAIDGEEAPTLTFVAYALQVDNIAAEDAIDTFKSEFKVDVTFDTVD